MQDTKKTSKKKRKLRKSHLSKLFNKVFFLLYYVALAFQIEGMSGV